MKKVLIVEDDHSISRLLESRLGRSGFEVVIARDGVKGLEQVIQERPDLVILDLMLPELSGEEVMKGIREDEENDIAEIPVIMLTAKATDVDRIIGKVVGANAYLTKPFNAEQLLTEVKRFTNASI
jgi:DNA-binding response OmpR family regulator